MKQKKLLVCIILLTGIYLSNIYAQNSFTTTGANLSGSGSKLSYSVGQVFNSTQNGSNGSISTGVHQPFEISVVTALKEAKGIHLEISTYPNPTTNNLQLNIEGENFRDFNYELFDMSGKVIESKRITGNQTNIEMTQLKASTYFLKLIQNNKETKTFKIIKK